MSKPFNYKTSNLSEYAHNENSLGLSTWVAICGVIRRVDWSVDTRRFYGHIAVDETPQVEKQLIDGTTKPQQLSIITFSTTLHV